MPKLLILKGLPASGKSTFCTELLTDTSWRRVNKDQIRLMLRGEDYYSHPDEKLVHDIYISNIKYVLERGLNVICDATQLAAKNEKELRQIALGFDAEVDVKFFDVPLDECIARDAKREGFAHVGEEVIRRFYDRYLKGGKFKIENPLTEEETSVVKGVEWIEGLPVAIMCDMDGTLADMGTRNPFHWKACIDDTVRQAVMDVLQTYAINNVANQIIDPEHEYPAEIRDTKIIIMSGRDSVCRPETEEWLKREGVIYDALFMRAEGDQRKDSIIKRELFDEHIRGKYNILFVLDDRNQVVDMWREMGLDCFQVAPGNF